MKQLIKSNFFKIPNGIYKLKLKPNELAVLCYLISYMNADSIFPSQKTISTATGISSLVTVRKTIKSLVKKKLISYQRGHSAYSNRYKILLINIDPNCLKISIRTKVKNNEEQYMSRQEFNAIINEAVKD